MELSRLILPFCVLISISSPHSIQRITPQNRTCNNCHGNAGLFLSKTDLAQWEIKANVGVVVPENRIPKVLDEGKK